VRSSNVYTIDDEVLIGMGAIILDGAEIGANALVTLGKKISPGSLVLGSPAKIKRSLTRDEQKDIARWAWSYVETANISANFTVGRDRRARRRRASVSDAIRYSLSAEPFPVGRDSVEPTTRRS
jgi:NDP-sugar pyrophosphorylase family protein